MRSNISKSLTISLAIAAALAMPTAVKAQSTSVDTTVSSASTHTDAFNAESGFCIPVPGYGWYGPSC